MNDYLISNFYLYLCVCASTLYFPLPDLYEVDAIGDLLLVVRAMPE